MADPSTVVDEALKQLQAVASGAADATAMAALSKRKLVTKGKKAYFTVAKGPSYAPVFAKQEAELTAAMLTSGAWKVSVTSGMSG